MLPLDRVAPEGVRTPSESRVEASTIAAPIR